MKALNRPRSFSPADQQTPQERQSDHPLRSDQPVPLDPLHLQAIRKLSAREREILLHLAQYKTMNQIAECLFISPTTVNNHKARMSEKLNLKGRYRLLHFAQSVQHLL